ncbi:hypothetical protein RCL1_002117 [Eukaryota sp. TZLM3-RCL]
MEQKLVQTPYSSKMSLKNVVILGEHKSAIIESLINTSFEYPKVSDQLTSLRVWPIPNLPYQLWEVISSGAKTLDLYALLPTAVAGAILVCTVETLSEATKWLPPLRDKHIMVVIHVKDETSPLRLDSILPLELKNKTVAIGNLMSKESLKNLKTEIYDFLTTNI